MLRPLVRPSGLRRLARLAPRRRCVGFDERPDTVVPDDDNATRRRLILGAEMVALVGLAAVVWRFALRGSSGRVEAKQQAVAASVREELPHVPKEAVADAVATLTECVLSRTDERLEGPWRLNHTTDVVYALETTHPRMSMERIAYYSLYFVPSPTHGLVEARDFALALVVIDEGSVEDRMRLVHRRLASRAASGDVGPAELVEGLQRANVRQPKRVALSDMNALAAQLVARCDVDGDGRLNSVEFSRCAETRRWFGLT